eukprot:CAMPEP_0114588630 /NCGR_PEP_ID=MMETSP0125-20121206/11279_1 /TAXON_ID=485358 ORGANISM="Aristerostoma sp., Strain ATCC 50986" /NCGR_SAMPLE_ID=MMETSP0125 /ASSEMBLY_ACC=CAM_ASM_000245 /LENGTH=154 /DNA_ID=CAMNT_0001785111 /DNA_START=56 /DNA_END=520 /DNA_ORIENTATION=+
MSWTDYTAHLRANNATDAAGILSSEDGTLVAGDNFQVSTYQVEIPTDDDKGTRKVDVNESANVLQVMKEGKCTSPAGMRIGGIKWQIVMTDTETGTVYLKKNKGGACLVKTNKTIVFGSWSEEQKIEGKGCPQNPGDCNKVTEGLAKILKDAGY